MIRQKSNNMVKQASLSIAYIVETLSARQLIEKYYPAYNIQVLATAESYDKMKPRLNFKKPDLIILDYQFMPDDIHSLIKEIKADNPKVKLVLMGMYNTLDIVETFLKSGADGYYDHHSFDGFENFFKTMLEVKNGTTVILPAKQKRKTYS